MLYGEYAFSKIIPVAIPVTEQSLFLFIVCMKKQQYAAVTTTSYVSAIGYVHKLAGTYDPASSLLVKKSLQAIRKMQPSCDTRLPITKDILHLLVSTAGHAIHSMYRLKLMQAMFMLAYHAFLLVGEITESEHDLFLSYVTLTTTSIKLLFLSSKHASGVSQEAMVSAMTGEMYCPVHALSEYMPYRGKNPGPLFLRRGKPLSRKDFVSGLKLLLSVAGIPDERFNSHSFRIGASTSCAAKGASDAQIRQLCRWHSGAFKRYIRSPNPLQQLH